MSLQSLSPYQQNVTPAVLHLGGNTASAVALAASNPGAWISPVGTNTSPFASPSAQSVGSQLPSISAGNNLPTAFSQLMQMLLSLIENFMQQLQSLMSGNSNSGSSNSNQQTNSGGGTGGATGGSSSTGCGGGGTASQSQGATGSAAPAGDGNPPNNPSPGATGSSTGGSTGGGSSSGDPNANSDQQQFLSLINNLRAQHGLNPVTLDSRLNQTAQDYAQAMSQAGQMTHTLNGTQFGDRLKQHGYNWSNATENIAEGQQSVQEAFQAWESDPGHLANLLAPGVTQIGLGESGGYWDQEGAAPA